MCLWTRHCRSVQISLPNTGIKLSELFYHEAVKPILTDKFSYLTYSAARLDGGSDVLGFDNPQSTDHGWGPRLTLYISEDDYRQHHERIQTTLAQALPLEIHGYSTNFDDGCLKRVDQGPVNHEVIVTTLSRFFSEYIGYDLQESLKERDWLTIPPQRLRTVASGKVFHDGLGQLEDVRQVLRWYPKDVWLYLMANQWRGVNQEEAFMGRSGDVGDELGSRSIAARLVHKLMGVCFLIERVHAPYSKWFGSAFAQLQCARELTPIFHNVFNSTTWKERENYLSKAYLIAARMHNELGVTSPLEENVSPYNSRPYLVLNAGRFVDALWGAVKSESLKSLTQHVGAIWQFADSTDVLYHVKRCKALASIYDKAAASKT